MKYKLFGIIFLGIFLIGFISASYSFSQNVSARNVYTSDFNGSRLISIVTSGYGKNFDLFFDNATVGATIYVGRMYFAHIFDRVWFNVSTPVNATNFNIQWQYLRRGAPFWDNLTIIEDTCTDFNHTGVCYVLFDIEKDWTNGDYDPTFTIANGQYIRGIVNESSGVTEGGRQGDLIVMLGSGSFYVNGTGNTISGLYNWAVTNNNTHINRYQYGYEYLYVLDRPIDIGDNNYEWIVSDTRADDLTIANCSYSYDPPTMNTNPLLVGGSSSDFVQLGHYNPLANISYGGVIADFGHNKILFNSSRAEVNEYYGYGIKIYGSILYDLSVMSDNSFYDIKDSIFNTVRSARTLPNSSQDNLKITNQQFWISYKTPTPPTNITIEGNAGFSGLFYIGYTGASVGVPYDLYAKNVVLRPTGGISEIGMIQSYANTMNRVHLINSKFNIYNNYVSGQAGSTTVFEEYTFIIKTTFSNNTPIQNANVTLKNNTGLIVFTQLTDSNGNILSTNNISIRQAFANASNPTGYYMANITNNYPFNLTITKDGFKDYELNNINITTPIDWTITLEEQPTWNYSWIPEFKILNKSKHTIFKITDTGDLAIAGNLYENTNSPPPSVNIIWEISNWGWLDDFGNLYLNTLYGLTN